VEWAKAWARTRRWTEEVRLLREEMCRVVITLWWKAGWWTDRSEIEEFEGFHAEGVRAYALRQAALMRNMANNFEQLWAGLRELEEVAGAYDLPRDEVEEEEEHDEDWLAGTAKGRRCSMARRKGLWGSQRTTKRACKWVEMYSFLGFVWRDELKQTFTAGVI
jgi:hypothetical protein